MCFLASSLRRKIAFCAALRSSFSRSQRDLSAGWMSSRIPAIGLTAFRCHPPEGGCKLNSGANAIVPSSFADGVRRGRADNPVHEGKLLDGYLGDDEGIEVSVAHAPVDVVESERQRHPPLDQHLEVARS